MTRSSHLVEHVIGGRTRRRICAVALVLTALGATPAAAQYGSEPPLPPLPPLQSAAPAAPTSAPTPSTPPSNPSGVAGAVGTGDTTPAGGTAGEVSDTDTEAPPVQVVSDERAAPVAADDDLPFTGANIGTFAAIGAGLLLLGLGVRRRADVRAAKP
jgi:hypothetical protein